MSSSLSGRDNAFEELFCEFFVPIRNFFGKQGRTPEESGDLAQETFLRAYRSFDSFRGDSKRSTWLFTIAKNVWRNHLRDAEAAKRDAEEVSLRDDHRASLSTDSLLVDDAVRAERQRHLESAIRSLPPQMQRCVLLRVYQGMKFRDIAEILGVTVGTAKSQVTLAKPRLKSLLAELYPEIGARLEDSGD